MIAVFEGADVRKIVDRIVKELTEDASELLDHIAEKVVFPSIARNFDDEGRPDKWAELRPRTQREREWEGYDPAHPILQRSGDLKKSVDHKNMLTDYRLTKHELVMSPMLRKAATLHFGDKLAGLVARPFFFLQDEDAKTAERVGIKFIQNKLDDISKETL